MLTGRIDVHSHLLPGVDDGSESVSESLDCARELVGAGYTHSFVTPHIWPNLTRVTVDAIVNWTAELQRELDDANIRLKLLPGGEINLAPAYMNTPIERIPTYGMFGRHVLVDLWADRLPDFFEPIIRWFQSHGLTVILAHPERMRAIQDQPELADRIQDMGVLLQGNLQCLSDSPTAATYRVIRRYLDENRYFMLGSDLHKRSSLDVRLRGLEHAIELVGEDKVNELTITHPRTLAPEMFGA